MPQEIGQQFGSQSGVSMLQAIKLVQRARVAFNRCVCRPVRRTWRALNEGHFSERHARRECRQPLATSCGQANGDTYLTLDEQIDIVWCLPGLENALPGSKRQMFEQTLQVL